MLSKRSAICHQREALSALCRWERAGVRVTHLELGPANMIRAAQPERDVRWGPGLFCHHQHVIAQLVQVSRIMERRAEGSQLSRGVMAAGVRVLDAT